jgi:hypothetical protein
MTAILHSTVIIVTEKPSLNKIRNIQRVNAARKENKRVLLLFSSFSFIYLLIPFFLCPFLPLFLPFVPSLSLFRASFFLLSFCPSMLSFAKKNTKWLKSCEFCSLLRQAVTLLSHGLSFPLFGDARSVDGDLELPSLTATTLQTASWQWQLRTSNLTFK